MDWIHELATTALHWIEGLGYWGIIIGLGIEVIPSEIVLSYGGYLVYQDKITFLGAVICGTIGAVLQQWILYAIGRYAGRPFFEKYGKFIKITPKHLDKAEGWFNRYGSGIVFTARFVPVMRQAISIPAGMARMNFWLFTGLTTAASIPWAILFVYLGSTLGDQWENIDEKAGQYVQPAILIAIALLVVYVLYKVLRKRGKTV
ncbi:membrane protein DedA with SNARE-associated domain [Paenibacillus phyllosphaerae]|uniref:Membrane protein DedA with SNARE-associated domain n=1 Tax=Paenibacillus phyllosphaerae TaxID=274593 RepID=A0A7W5FKX4_9BACL|nr:DedA family protein [Paenibacillus phyllosphaerae]MBB3108508.1 membrane protein DedA with SNARE-associated domain [Paenibacillus phyllosphaerae]